jgi:hypothetical protein
MPIWVAWTLAATAIILYAGAHWGRDFSDWRVAYWIPCWMACCCLLFRYLKAGQPHCWLSWDGNKWQIQNLYPSFNATTEVGANDAMAVHLDFQKLLFVSLQSDKGKRHWFWLSQESFPDRWHGFRCAVYSRSEELSS